LVLSLLVPARSTACWSTQHAGQCLVHSMVGAQHAGRCLVHSSLVHSLLASCTACWSLLGSQHCTACWSLLGAQLLVPAWCTACWSLFDTLLGTQPTLLAPHTSRPCAQPASPGLRTRYMSREWSTHAVKRSKPRTYFSGSESATDARSPSIMAPLSSCCAGGPSPSAAESTWDSRLNACSASRYLQPNSDQQKGLQHAQELEV
jgi:hypothetical protein